MKHTKYIYNGFPKFPDLSHANRERVNTHGIKNTFLCVDLMTSPKGVTQAISIFSKLLQDTLWVSEESAATINKYASLLLIRIVNCHVLSMPDYHRSRGDVS